LKLTQPLISHQEKRKGHVSNGR